VCGVILERRRKTKRQRDKETKRQRDKETKRQRDKETKRQRDKVNLLDDAKVVQIWIVEGDIHRNKSGSSSNPESFLEFIDNGSRWSSQ
jgi:hypothetical protein